MTNKEEISRKLTEETINILNSSETVNISPVFETRFFNSISEKEKPVRKTIFQPAIKYAVIILLLINILTVFVLFEFGKYENIVDEESNSIIETYLSNIYNYSL